jgi:hypothetical protein
LANAQSLPSVPNKFIIEVDELARFNTKRSFTRVGLSRPRIEDWPD